jgi:membrane protease YdiL (CAAX protease family)
LDAASSPLDGRRAVRIGVTYLLVQAAFHLLALPFSHHAPQGTSPAIYEIPAMFVGQVVAVFIAWRMTLSTFVGSPDPEALRAIGWSRSSPRVVAGGAAMGFLAAMAVMGAAVRFPSPVDHTGPMVTLLANAPAWCSLVAVLMVVALAPPTEEFLFRGVLLHGLGVSYGPRLAAILVTAVFVIGHLPNVGNDWVGILVHIAVAIGLLAARVSTGSLLPPVAMHAAYNSGLFVFGYLWAR